MPISNEVYALKEKRAGIVIDTTLWATKLDAQLILNKRVRIRTNTTRKNPAVICEESIDCYRLSNPDGSETKLWIEKQCVFTV